MDAFNRVKLLLGNENFLKLNSKSVLVFGVGGVGGYVIEALARTGIGKIGICDKDRVSVTNINRQIIATTDTIDKEKTAVMKDRLLSINPDIKVEVYNEFFLPENADFVNFNDYDYIVDAIDTVKGKLEIIERAKSNNIPVISCMGTAGKLNPEQLKVSYIEKTEGCPLARVMRRELKKKGIKKVKVIYSTEEQRKNLDGEGVYELKGRRPAPPSMIFVPATAGILIAKEVVMDLLNS